MWKLSCIFLLLIGNCSTLENADDASTERSTYDRNHDDLKNRPELTNNDHPNVNSRLDSDYANSGKLIGKWTNNGAAFEPKWRDGDSVPLVPFDAAKRGKIGRHEETENSEYRESSQAIEKSHSRDLNVGKIFNARSFDDVVTEDDSRQVFDDENSRNDQGDRSSSSMTKFSSISKKNRPTIGTDDSLDDEKKNAETSEEKTFVKDDKTNYAESKSRYVDAFQTDANDYDPNDDEYRKPRPRKRRPPQNYEFADTRPPSFSITWSTERYVETTTSPDRPKWAKIPTSTTTTTKKSIDHRSLINDEISKRQRGYENAELKTLLKMRQIEGRLSLSEILQRRNLTLADLLNGKPEVIDALRTRETNVDDDEENLDEEPKIFRANKIFSVPILRNADMDDRNPTGTIVGISHNGNDVSAAFETKTEVSSGVALSRNADEDDYEKSVEHLDSAETENARGNKSNDDEKLSAIVAPTEPIISTRFDSHPVKSIVVATIPIVSSVDEAERKNSTISGKSRTTNSNNNNDDDEIMEFSDFTTKKNEIVTATIRKSVTATTTNSEIESTENRENSESTLSIEHILGITDPNFEIFDSTTRKIDDEKLESIVIERSRDDDSLLHRVDAEYRMDEAPIVDDGSSEKSAITDRRRVDAKDDNDENFAIATKIWRNHQIFSTSSKPYEVVISEIEPEARAEIFEILNSGSSAENLERLLEARNMSVDELVALRQRGSSKVHMAEVLRSSENYSSRSFNPVVDEKSFHPEKKIKDDTTTDDVSSATKFYDLSNVNVESMSDEIVVDRYDEDRTNVVSLRNVETTVSSTTEKSGIHSTNDERTSPTTSKKISNHLQLFELLTAFDSLPFSIRPDLDRKIGDEINPSNETNDRTIDVDSVKKMVIQDSPTNHVEIGFVEEIGKEESIVANDSSTTNVRTNYSSTLGEDGKKLSKVKPSIIASGAILGVTIVVFLAIFIVCRIRQKQKYTYRNTFSRSVFQGPAVTARKLSNSSSLNTIMVNVVATSTTKRPHRHDQRVVDDDFDFRSDIENDSLDANDSWDTIPDFMK